MTTKDALLKINNLTVAVRSDRKMIPIVKGIDLTVFEGQVIGLVGESGCGKSMTAKAINGILPPKVKVTGGSILWNGDPGAPVDLAGQKEKELRSLCGSDISMVFQEPMTTLNPLMRIGDQVGEPLLIHHLVKNREEMKSRVIKLLYEVGIPEPELRYRAWPHELSGGMRQRVVIAMAAVCDPKLFIADEPTTALDVTIEAQILALMKGMCEKHSMSAIVITHNMRVVARICDYVYVMYMGRIMEQATAAQLFSNPVHPYTRGLLSSVPDIRGNPEYLTTIPGSIPELKKDPKGCEFCLRCSDDIRDCFFTLPELRRVEEGHYVRCHSAVK